MKPATNPLEQAERRVGTGRPLDVPVRVDLERALGTPVGPVGVHTGQAAARLAREFQAHAFTVGSDVFFGARAYQPDTTNGFRLLAHEVTHVLQNGPVASRSPLDVSRPTDPEERQADEVADRAVTRRARLGNTSPTTASSGLRSSPGSSRAFGGRALTSASATAKVHRSEPDPTLPKNEPRYRNRRIATWIWGMDSSVQTQWAVGEVPLVHYFEPFGSIPGSITRQGWTPGRYATEAEALAAIRAAGTAGAIFVEDGQYIAYHARSNAMFYNFTTENVRWFPDKPWTAVKFEGEPPPLTIVLEDGVALKAEHFKTKDDAKAAMSDEALMPGADADPFVGYKAAFGDLNKPGILELVIYPAMRDYTLSLLSRSRAVAERHIERFSSSGMVTAAELDLMRKTAVYLAGLDDEIDKVPKEIPPDPDAFRWFTQLQDRRKVVLVRYPMLSRINPREFVKLTEDQQMVALAGTMFKVVSDIDDTRNNILDGTLSLWKIPSLVDSTIAGLGIEDPVLRKRVKDLAEASQSSVGEDLLTLFTIVIGFASMAVTGPLGIAVAAGALGLSVADAIKQTEEIAAEHAAANTDPNDPSKSILPPEDARSWGWLVLAWGGVVADAAQLLSAIKAVKSAGGALEAGVKTLSKGDEALAKQLRLAAGIADATEIVSEANKAGLARRLRATLEIDASLGAEVRVYYHVDSEGRAVLDGVRAGPKATVGTILAHESVVKMLKRYDGLLGRLREIIDKFLSLGPARFTPGSEAFNSFLEVQKLPDVLAARRMALGTALTAESEAVLKRDIDFLENELARHQQVVEQMVAEQGATYVAAAEEQTKKAIESKLVPDIFNSEKVKDPSKYYYRTNPRGDPPYILTRFANSDAPPLTLVRDSSGGWVIAEGALSRSEEAAAIVGGWKQGFQDAFEAVKTKFTQGVYKVVPLRGVASTGKKIRDIMTGAQQAELYEVLVKAFSASGKEADPAARATSAMTRLLDHDVTLVRGTDQLRAFNYRLAFEKATGEAAEGDLHHLIPLYLGGDNVKLIDVAGDLHDQLHRIIDKVTFAPGFTLAPGSIGQGAGLAFNEGAAVLYSDGRVQLLKLLEDGTYAAVP